MITLNDYLYSGDTVLRILQKYIADLKVEADRNRNEIDRVHCDFLAQIRCPESGKTVSFAPLV